MMTRIKTVIVGSGIAGISSGYHEFLNSGTKSIILEKNTTYGGLLDNLQIRGFLFDTFVHLSFTKDEYVKELFSKSTDYIVHTPNPYNFTNGIWVKHPIQNNLKKLPAIEKVKILYGFLTRTKNDNPKNYEEWLIAQYGLYFYEHYPKVYTRKYWFMDPKDMGVDWVGQRMYKPSLREVIKGTLTLNTSDVYYATEMRYPINGGFKSFLGHMVKDLDIRYSSEVVNIDLNEKKVVCKNGDIYVFEKLISSLPLPMYLSLIDNIPTNIVNAIKKLKWTAAIVISMGFNVPNITDKLWFYIYDEDIKASRMHSPSMKSVNNAPKGYSSLQSEIYFLGDEIHRISVEEVVNNEINSYIKKGFFKQDELLFHHYKVVDYANVIFDHSVYESRKLILQWLKLNNIEPIGRFGHWDYYWTDDSLLSGVL